MAWVDQSYVSTGDLITASDWNQAVVDNPEALRPVAVEFWFTGGGAAYAAGAEIGGEVPFPGTIDRWTIVHFAGTTPTTQFDVQTDTYANAPPDNSDSMPGSGNEPATSSAAKAQSSSLGSWTSTDFSAGDIVRAVVDSNDTAENSLLSLKVTKG